MKEFVHLKTVFKDASERTIDRLSEVYQDQAFLKSAIAELMDASLTSEVIQGKRVLLKPNWVYHNKKDTDEICLRTHDNFLLAALEVVLSKKPASVIMGDAPIQGCYWDEAIRESLKKSVEILVKKYNIHVEIKDFRRVTFDPRQNNPVKERNPLSEYVIFDLGKDSYLEPISSKKNIFRVTNYDPDRLAESHTIGMHKYCLTKELFDAEVVISIPKIKTHQKTGVTGALKNLVGVNGDKDYLPHHRVGGKDTGGDCYPGGNILRRLAEYFLDAANRKQGKPIFLVWMFVTKVLWKLSLPEKVHHLAAGWYGNDTTWRMVMDLNKVAVFGKKDGSISELPQRVLFSLCDGVIGGQGDGPLKPTPLALGVISFTNNSAMNDICMGTFMGFDLQKIPLLKTALQIISKKNISITLNGEDSSLKNIENLSIQTLPPPGWVDYLTKA
ncbi:MAG: DUF362 domain-containing protein [Bacteroidales bacterium]